MPNMLYSMAMKAAMEDLPIAAEKFEEAHSAFDQYDPVLRPVIAFWKARYEAASELLDTNHVRSLIGNETHDKIVYYKEQN